MTANLPEGLEAPLPEWLASQRWFSGEGEAPASARVIDSELLRDSWPKLLWTLIEVDGGAVYQVPIGLQEEEHIGGVLLGHGRALIGKVTDEEGRELLAYDALIDSVLGRALFDVVCDGEIEVKSMRPVGAEQSNTSLVFDNRLIMKVFRRLYEGANPDLEVTAALTDAGFKHVAPVVAQWKKHDWDLAVTQPYLWDGTDGWKLALASVRDLLGPDTHGGSSPPGSPAVRIDPNDPASAGGDFADEAARLGAVTAELHLALCRQFGAHDFDPEELVSSLRSGLSAVSAAHVEGLSKLIERVQRIAPGRAGRACRVHGDYHLGQTLRSVSGWYIFDFEGEPARPLTERVRPSSPAKDVTGMLRSFGYAVAAGIREHIPAEQPELGDVATAWEARNRDAFISGYLGVEGIDTLLPAEGEERETILAAFEVEKAIYELGYEKAYRPDWVSIPEAALERLLAG